MSKDCDHHKEKHHHLFHRILVCIVSFIILILFIIFIIWLILRPTKPRFILQDATVYAFNLSTTTTTTSPTPNTLSTTMQVTLSSFNPNRRISIIYQKLDVYASYRGQQISLATELPPSYQGHRDVSVWSPFLYGTTVPVSPYVLGSLQQDQNAGGVLVNVKVNGRIKWKVGTWVSGRYHVYVNCPAYIRFVGDRDNAVGVENPGVKLQLVQSCTVDV